MQSRLPFLFVFFITIFSFAVKAQEKVSAPKPLFVDPVYDGATDPVIVWNKAEKKWLMFYTARRATIDDTTGVK